MKTLTDVYVLSNGVKIPKIGFGTWQINDGKDAYESVTLALKNGYRHIDTAQGYRNEASVARAIKDSGIPREEIFITSKLESHIKTYEGTKEAFEQTMEALGFDYIDLFLIHAPWPWNEIGKDCKEGNVLAWKAMEEFYEQGRIRAIGVSNFNTHDLEYLMAHAKIKPHVNQIGFFIGHNQLETHTFCKKHDILVEAYSPLAIGYALTNEHIVKMAEKYEKTPAQICIRYCIEKETLPLPKSTHESRIIENTQVDFKMDPKDIEFLDTLKDDPRKWS